MSLQASPPYSLITLESVTHKSQRQFNDSDISSCDDGGKCESESEILLYLEVNDLIKYELKKLLETKGETELLSQATVQPVSIQALTV